ncbi:MAG: orotidine-5'-phosphate decarboxylase [Candidatus Peribacteraceae bacterium]|nr:orotidine-5'-phosphate decarboxylase [Candidatus Peribacteraceae bacterium]
MHFADLLTARSRSLSPICVGLDPALSKLPETVSKDAAGILAFGKGIINAVSDIAAAVKPQLAYYEALGWEGMKAFWETCAYAKGHGLVVIADGKRNDIGSTCEAYADAYLNAHSPIDALTVCPYLGSDTVQPFIERCEKNNKGIFVLVKTSNPSSGELQDLPVGDEVVHEHMAQLTESWGAGHLGKTSGYSCVGAVVGATYPEELKYLRTLMPHSIILIPGYGTQGGTAADVAHGFAGGQGAIVVSARAIIFASNKHDWQEAARAAAEKMKEELSKALKA